MTTEIEFILLDRIACSQVLTCEERRYWFLMREHGSAYRVRNIINAERELCELKPYHVRTIQMHIKAVVEKVRKQYRSEHPTDEDAAVRYGIAVEAERFFTGNTASDSTQKRALQALGVR